LLAPVRAISSSFSYRRLEAKDPGVSRVVQLWCTVAGFPDHSLAAFQIRIDG
jgi:hypothetical protein